MSRYFIDRPIFAWVLAIILMLAGVLAIRSMAIAQFPNIAPPAISVTATYPGADAQTLENTTTQVIEQQLIGLDHLQSTSRLDFSKVIGKRHQVTVTFAQGHRSRHRASPGAEQGSGRVNRAIAARGADQEGLTVTKSVNSDFAARRRPVIRQHATRPLPGRRRPTTLSPPISRIRHRAASTGVGQTNRVRLANTRMRIWLDPGTSSPRAS